MFQNLRRMMPGSETLKIRCEVCDHAAEWTSEEAFRWLGPDASPFEIRQKLVCRLCRGRAHVWI